MLKQRVITGFVLVPAFLYALFRLPEIWFIGVLAVIAAYAAWEWVRLVSMEHRWVWPIFLVLCLLTGVAVYTVLDAHAQKLLLLTTCLYWGAILFLLVSFQTGWLGQRRLKLFFFASGILIIPMGWWSLVRLYSQGQEYFLILMLIVWLADSAAYFSGKRFGRHKLAVVLSPGKTIEGVVGAAIATLILSCACVWYFDMPIGFALYFMVLSLAVAMISVVGDLFESVLKRNANVKDSGTVIPGHGGVLDRIDSLLAAAPVFALGLYWV